jgi:hypothetical protein
MHRQLLGLSAFVLVSVGYAAEPDAARIERLIKQLGSEKFSERDAASKALEDIGKAALPALEKTSNNGDLELRLRAKAISEAVVQRLRRGLPADIRRLGGKVEVIGIEGLRGEFVKVTLRHTKAKDADATRLRWMERLRYLDLSDTGVTDAVLSRLGTLPDLEELDLTCTKATDLKATTETVPGRYEGLGPCHQAHCRADRIGRFGRIRDSGHGCGNSTTAPTPGAFLHQLIGDSSNRRMPGGSRKDA